MSDGSEPRRERIPPPPPPSGPTQGAPLPPPPPPPDGPFPSSGAPVPVARRRHRLAPIVAGVLVAAVLALLGLVAYSVWTRGDDRESEWRTYAGRYVDTATNEAIVLESNGQWRFSGVSERGSSGASEVLKWDVYDAGQVPESSGYVLQGNDAAVFVPVERRGGKTRGWYFAIQDSGETLVRLNDPGDPTPTSQRYVGQSG